MRKQFKAHPKTLIGLLNSCSKSWEGWSRCNVSVVWYKVIISWAMEVWSHTLEVSNYPDANDFHNGSATFSGPGAAWIVYSNPSVESLMTGDSVLCLWLNFSLQCVFLHLQQSSNSVIIISYTQNPWTEFYTRRLTRKYKIYIYCVLTYETTTRWSKWYPVIVREPGQSDAPAIILLQLRSR